MEPIIPPPTLSPNLAELLGLVGAVRRLAFDTSLPPPEETFSGLGGFAMRKWTIRMVGGTAVLAGVLWGGVGTAGADPKRGTQLSCGGTTYEVVVAGNGNWTPAHDADNNVIFIPTRFGDFHGTVLDAEGNLVDELVEEGDVPKGQSDKNKGDILECTFSFTEVSDGSDPEFREGFMFIGEGEVRGFATPAPESERERGRLNSPQHRSSIDCNPGILRRQP